MEFEEQPMAISLPKNYARGTWTAVKEILIKQVEVGIDI